MYEHHLRVWCTQARRGTGSLGIGVPDGSEPSDAGNANLGAWREYLVLSATDHLSPPNLTIFKCKGYQGQMGAGLENP